MDLTKLLLLFRPLFSASVWPAAVILVEGAILAPGKRTVSVVLRVMGLAQRSNYQNYHRVINRAVWSSRQASFILLRHLMEVFVPVGPLVMGLDDTIVRRWGEQIEARGIYRDPGRSSNSHFVKVSGLRWLSLMLLVPLPWAERTWALVQMSIPVYMVTRLRLDAQLYEPAPPRQPRQMGRLRTVGQRLSALKTRVDNPDTAWQVVVVRDWYGLGEYTLKIASATAVWYKTGMPAVPIRWVLVVDPAGKFDPQALLCTDTTAAPQDILNWFRQRWQVEVTFEEVRTHLGVETQRQWSSKAILRTTPALLALISLVTILAHQHDTCWGSLPRPNAAWYKKSLPTFADALALVRQQLWQLQTFQRLGPDTDMVKVPRVLFNTWSDLLCHAA